MTDFPSYAYGTVTIEAGATEIVGTDTNWSGVNARAGDDIKVDGHVVDIVDVIDETHLKIDAWPYDAATDAEYKIVQRSPLRFVGGVARADLTQLLSTLKAKGLLWYLPDGLTEPDDARPPLTADDGQGILDITTKELWVMTGGAWVSAGRFSGFGTPEDYDSGKTYQPLDIVIEDGTVYLVKAETTGNAPPDDDYYSVIAPAGTAATVMVGAVITGAGGSSAVVTNSGTANAAVLDFTIPAGKGYGGTSDTEMTIGTGSKTFATQAGLAYTIGNRVHIGATGSELNWMEGFITAYSGTSMTVAVSDVDGSGTFDAWGIGLTGKPGAGDGDMKEAIYDPAGKNTSAFNTENHDFLQSGTDMVPTTTYLRFKEELRAADAGLIGSGDEGAKFAALINEAMASERRLVLSPGGVYTLETWATLTQAGDIIIQGNGATIRGPATPDPAKRFLLPTGLVDINDVVFDRWSHILRCDESDSGTPRVYFNENEVKNCDYIPILIERPFTDVWIEENYLHDNTGGYVVRLGTNTDAGQANWKGAKVKGNRFVDNSGTGTISTAAILNYGDGSEISGNYIDGVASVDGEAWGIYTKQIGGRVQGNLVQNVNASGSSGGALDVVGISIKGANRATTDSGVQGFNNIVSGNTVRKIGAQQVKGLGIRAQNQSVLVSGNSVEDVGAEAFNVDDANGGSDISIVTNHYYSSAFLPPAHGVKVLTHGGRYVVAGNILPGVLNGITIGADSGTLAAVEITGNQIRFAADGSGVNIDNAGTIYSGKICGNIIDAASTGTCIKATNLGTLARFAIEDNDASLAVDAGATFIDSSILAVLPRMRGNAGFKSRASGNAELASGATVAHGLAGQPNFVSITPINGLVKHQAGAANSATFTVTHDGGGSTYFYWEARLPYEDAF